MAADLPGRFALLALVAILVAASCSSPSTDDEPSVAPTSSETSIPSETSTSTERPFSDDAPDRFAVEPVQWEPCPLTPYDCATVAVPLDHDEPAGATIGIAVTRLAATGTRRGSIFVNPGGPGASGVEFVHGGFSFDEATMAAYDLVGFDPRGIGASNPLTCVLARADGPLPDYSPDDAGEAAALDEAARQIADRCAESDGELLANVDTESVASDLDLLRIAVGDDQLHYYGFSFGTLIGQVYAELFPGSVGHIALDGVVDPGATLPDLLRQQAEAFERSFDRLDAACGQSAAEGLDCPVDGIAETYRRVLERIEASGPVGQFGPSEFEAAALVTVYNEGLWPLYAGALTDADQGDFSPLEALSDLFLSGVSFTAYAAVECFDTPHPTGAEAWDAFAAELEELAPRFGPWIANELRTCAYWREPGRPARGPLAAAGARPILVIGTTNDPATPLANAQTAAENLESATLVIHEGDRHTAYRASVCVQAIVADYFLDDVLPPSPARC